jgi:hypothetical protein
MTRGRWFVVGLVVVLVLVSPLLAGYFGPTAATYAQSWLPWRTHLHVTVQEWGPGYTRTDRARTVAEYSDPWPGSGRTPGQQVVFVTLSRPSVLLPWVVTERGSGP